MQQLTQDQLEDLRSKLEIERDELEEELAAHGRVQDESGDWSGASAGADGEESDPSDVADQIEELVTNVPLVEQLEERHEDVTDALEKIDNGTYGMCEECGKRIEIERLEANPSARTCKADAQ